MSLACLCFWCLCFWTLTSFFVANFVQCGMREIHRIFSPTWKTLDFMHFLKILLFKAIIGMFFQDGLTGSAWGDWSLYTASPLRAGRESKVARNFFGGDSTSYASFDPAKELGVQDPIGFWDPLGLSADKDEATFKRRRAVEIKHGRIVRVQVVLNQWIRSHAHSITVNQVVWFFWEEKSC